MSLIVSDPKLPSPGRALGAAPEDHRLHLVENARQPQLREHPIDAVGRLLHVLHEQDRVLEVGQQPGADDRRQHREVAADDPAARASGVIVRMRFSVGTS